MEHHDPPAARRAPHPLRPTVRLRLALLCGAMVVATGALVLMATFTLQVTTNASVTVGPSAGQRSGTVTSQVASALPAGGPGPCAGLLGQGRAAAPASGTTTARPAPQTASALPACLAALPPGPLRDEAIAHFGQQVSSAQRQADLRQLGILGVMVLGVLAVLAVAVGWFVAGRALRPLQVMTRRVRELSGQTPLGRIALAGPDDELKALGDTFDALLGRLDAALATERRFVANASHELRTPLAITQTLLDVGLTDPAADATSLREMAERLRLVNARSERLIDGLLALARSQQAVERWEAADLAAAARDGLAAGAAEASALGLTIETELNPAPVRGDPVLLERLVGNLIENGIRHNVPGGWLRVRGGAEGDRAVLTVSNGGAPVAPEAVAGLFEPFRRGGPDRTGGGRGAGLGLSIATAVAAAHGGEIRADALAEGGLQVTVELPLAREGSQAP